jgi:hypothetical protein
VSRQNFGSSDEEAAVANAPCVNYVALKARVSAMRQHQRLYAERMRLARERTAELLRRLRAQGALPAWGAATCRPDEAESGDDVQHLVSYREEGR